MARRLVLARSHPCCSPLLDKQWFRPSLVLLAAHALCVVAACSLLMLAGAAAEVRNSHFVKLEYDQDEPFLTCSRKVHKLGEYNTVGSPFIQCAAACMREGPMKCISFKYIGNQECEYFIGSHFTAGFIYPTPMKPYPVMILRAALNVTNPNIAHRGIVTAGSDDDYGPPSILTASYHCDKYFGTKSSNAWITVQLSKVYNITVITIHVDQKKNGDLTSDNIDIYVGTGSSAPQKIDYVLKKPRLYIFSVQVEGDVVKFVRTDGEALVLKTIEMFQFKPQRNISP